MLWRSCVEKTDHPWALAPSQSCAIVPILGGTRQACVARELTKTFEELRRGTLSDLTAHYADTGAPKGEVVVRGVDPREALQGGVGHKPHRFDFVLEDASGKRTLLAVSAEDAETRLAGFRGFNPGIAAHRRQALLVAEAGQRNLADVDGLTVGVAAADHAVLADIDRGQITRHITVLLRRAGREFLRGL